MTEKFKKIRRFITKFFILTIGILLVSVGLELFLIPNNIIDGGVVGISIISSYLTKMPLGVFIFSLNIPFLVFGYKKLGTNFILTSLYCIILLSITVGFFHGKESATHDLLLACIFGGIIIGTGLGMILRNNGSLDGTEIVAVILNKKTGFSIGEIIMIVNFFILGSAGFIFGWDRAMYSLITFFIIFKTVDVVMEGFNESKSVIIISKKYKEIAKVIIENLGRGVTYIEGQGVYTGEPRKIVFCVITRLELASLKDHIHKIDPSAFIAIENVHEVHGGLVKKSKKKSKKKIFDLPKI